MPNVAIKIVNQSHQPIEQAGVRRAVSRTLRELPPDRRWHVVIRFVDDKAMHALNKRYLTHDYSTDVLSFPVYDFQKGRPPALPPGPLLLGEVVVNLDEAKRISTASGHSLLKEVQSKIAHGVQHLVGYHHE